MPKKTNHNPVTEEKLAEAESEAMAHHSGDPSIDASATDMDEEAEKALIVEEATGAEQVIPAEVAAIHTDNASEAAEAERAFRGSGADESALEMSKLDRKKAGKAERKATKETKVRAPKTAKRNVTRSAKYLKSKEHIEMGKLYPLSEAMELVKKVSFSKFDGAVEVHLRLATKKSKAAAESTRGILQLPHGTGKEKNIVVIDEKMIEEIAKTKKIPFDIAIATPEMMPKVAKIAKILGPRGRMPDPKSGTVSSNPAAVIAEIKAGKTEYRIDANNNVHQVIGRVSWEDSKLLENAKVVITAFPKGRLLSAYLAPSIGPSVAIDLTKV